MKITQTHTNQKSNISKYMTNEGHVQFTKPNWFHMRYSQK